MKITGTRDHIRVVIDDRIAWFDGELGIDGFYAIANSMRWLPPYDKQMVTLEERKEVIAAVRKESEGREFQIYFDI